jgi:ABC-2 type transport system ATP-binding protein
MLEVHGISRKFGNLYAVNNLSFSVRGGEIFGFLGPNGAGKTTTMRILTGYMPATSGYFTVQGLDSRSRDIEIKKRIGYLPEHTPLYGDMFVQEYLEYAGKIRGIFGKKLSSAIDSMLEMCSITDVRNKTVEKLSKGYRQRVGLAQAMLHDPDLLILDEPLSGLDPNQIIEIRELIRRIGKEKTVIYCSHILSEVDKTCDRLLIINNGSKVALDSPKAIIAAHTSSHSYTLRVTSLPETLPTALENEEYITGVTPNRTTNTLRIYCRDDAQYGSRIIEATRNTGVLPEEITRDTKTLEEVFTSLTAKGEPHK